MKILVLFLLAFFTSLPLSSSASVTAKCVPAPKSVKTALKQSAAVFVGEVLEVNKGGSFVEARFRLERSWKGVRADEVSLITDRTSESPHYLVGEKYLVFAGMRSGRLFTGNCSRTRLVEYAQSDLQQLEGRRSASSGNVKPLPELPDLTSASDNELQQHLGEKVIIRGRFSLFGKLGPFIIVGARPIYLESQVSSSGDKRYEELEGRDVRVTGTLRYVRYPKPRWDLPEGRPSDHFYFEADTVTVEIMGR